MLICHETVAVFKEYNLKRHFQTKHANCGHNLSKQELQKKATDVVKGLKQQQTVFEKATDVVKGLKQQQTVFEKTSSFVFQYERHLL